MDTKCKCCNKFFTEQIYKIWLPAAIRYGIDICTFWTLNPRIMYAYQDAYIEQKQEEMQMLEVNAYMAGIYNMRAIAAIVDGKKHAYPSKPLMLTKGKEQEPEELTEEQKIEYQRQLLMQLQVMQSNFDTGNKSKE